MSGFGLLLRKLTTDSVSNGSPTCWLATTKKDSRNVELIGRR